MNGINWPAVLTGMCGLLLGALTPISLLAGRLARLETRCDAHDRESESAKADYKGLALKQEEMLGLLYRIAAHSGISTRG